MKEVTDHKFYFVTIVMILFLFCIDTVSKQRNIKLEWNKTDRDMTSNVHDSIMSFYNLQNKRGTIFFLYGKGIYNDKDNLDGIYYFEEFSSHSHPHLLLIHNQKILIVRSGDYDDVIVEVSKFAYENNLNNACLRKIYFGCFDYFLLDYQQFIIANSRTIESQLDDKEYIIRKIICKSSIEKVLNIYHRISSHDDLKYQFTSAALSELNDEEKILLIGLIGEVPFLSACKSKYVP